MAMATAPTSKTMRNAVDTALVYGPRRLLLETDDVLELVEKALLDVLRLGAAAAQRAWRRLLFLGQIGGNHEPHKDQLIAAPSRAHVRDAAAVDADGLAVLRAGWDFDSLRTIHRRNFHGVAQGGLRHAQGQLVDDIGAVSLQHRVGFDLDDDVQVPRAAAARTHLAFT